MPQKWQTPDATEKECAVIYQYVGTTMSINGHVYFSSIHLIINASTIQIPR